MRVQQSLGIESEKRALEWFLFHRQARLIEKNFRCRGGEIDLIFEERVSESYFHFSSSTELVFVEVRACTDRNWLTGPETLTLKKQRRLVRAARVFLAHYSGNSKTLRFDLLFWDGIRWTHLPHLLLPV